jgi:uncharacterized glyoxalase superfamily protein PhnB
MPNERLDGSALAASLTVNDIHKSLAWYRDVLGFDVAREFARDERLFAVRLKAGAVTLLLTQDDGAKGRDRAKGEGFSLQITTSQNVDDVARAVTERGGTLDMPPEDTRWGARVFRVRDPDGFRFTISSERGA